MEPAAGSYLGKQISFKLETILPNVILEIRK
jgi:hypothetical protein